MAIVVRVVLTVLGFALVGAGVLYGILGVWAADRGSRDGWILALLGFLVSALGVRLVVWALRRGNVAQ